MSAQIRSTGLREKLAALAPVIEGLSHYGAVEGSVEAAEGAERFIREIAALIRQYIGQVFSTTVVLGDYLDQGDAWNHALEASYRRLERSLSRWQRLGPRRGRANARDRCFEAIVEFSQAAEELRAAIITHDRAARPQSAEDS